MSYCCMPYRVDFKRLRAVRKSRDAALLARVVELAKEFGDGDEDEDEDTGEDEEDDPYDAAAHRFLNGEPPDPATLDAHEHVMGLVCMLCSAPLANCESVLKRIRAQVRVADEARRREGGSFANVDRLQMELVQAHLREVEAALERHAVADRIELRQLFAAGYPGSPISASSSFSVGYMTSAMVERARGVLDPDAWKELAPEVRQTLSVIRRGIDAAGERGYGVQGEASYSSQIVSVVPLNVARVEALRGSRSRVFYERLLFSQVHRSAYTIQIHQLTDEEFLAWKEKHYPDDPSGEEPAPDLPSVPRAAWELLHKTRLDEERADFYAMALHLICVAIGTPLENAAVAPADPSHFAAVDEALESGGLQPQISMQKLIFGGPPIRMPQTDDFPTVGYMAPRTVSAARGQIAGRDWSQSPEEVQRTLHLVNGWIEEAASRGEGLVCFYQ
jgi:hypothetical protein